MENIGLIQKRCFEIYGQKFVVNYDQGSLFVSNNGVLYIYNFCGEELASNQNMIPFCEEDNEILVMEHLPELDSVCCILKSGRAFLCDLCGLTAEELEREVKTCKRNEIIYSGYDFKKNLLKTFLFLPFYFDQRSLQNFVQYDLRYPWGFP